MIWGISGMKKGKKKLKKNTFLDYVACAKHLIDQRYTFKGGICFYGGSAGGLTGGALANMAPELFFYVAPCSFCRHNDYNAQ